MPTSALLAAADYGHTQSPIGAVIFVAFIFVCFGVLPIMATRSAARSADKRSA